MASLPLCTVFSSPLSGRLADRLEARVVASLGLGFILLGIFFYARLGISSDYFLVVVALSLIGVGSGFFMPANQKAAFSAVGSEHYGILSAMLSSFGTAAGSLGTTIVVALTEAAMPSRELQDPGNFAAGQQFAFFTLLPLGVIALLISLVGSKSAKEKR